MKITNREFIPTKTRTCHASTIVFDSESDLERSEPIIAWFGGQREGMPDSAIYVQYKGVIKSLGAKVNMPYWNPILFKIKNEVFLSYKRGKFCDCWQTYILNITEHLKDFDESNFDESKSQLIPAGLNFCVKTKPLIDAEFHIYCGSSVETPWDWTSYIEKYSYNDNDGIFEFISRSDPLTVDKKEFTTSSIDRGFHQKIARLTQGIIQPSLWQDKSGVIHAFFRSSRGLGKIYYSQHSFVSSYQKGHEDYWSAPEPTELKNPNSSVDTVYSYDERLFLVHNPSDSKRTPLVIKELDDYLEESVDEIVIREEPEYGAYTQELSYPFMIEHDNKLHLTYTNGRNKIEYVTIEI